MCSLKTHSKPPVELKGKPNMGEKEKWHKSLQDEAPTSPDSGTRSKVHAGQGAGACVDLGQAQETMGGYAFATALVTG